MLRDFGIERYLKKKKKCVLVYVTVAACNMCRMYQAQPIHNLGTNLLDISYFRP